MQDWTPEEIRQFRKANNFTRKALGELLGVTGICIYYWERGLRKPGKPTKILLSKIKQEIEKEIEKERR